MVNMGCKPRAMVFAFGAVGGKAGLPASTLRSSMQADRVQLGQPRPPKTGAITRASLPSWQDS